jgi:hypothetical protein
MRPLGTMPNVLLIKELLPQFFFGIDLDLRLPSLATKGSL